MPQGVSERSPPRAGKQGRVPELQSESQVIPEPQGDQRNPMMPDVAQEQMRMPEGEGAGS